MMAKFQQRLILEKMNRRLLIVVAHPDDEVLGCFGTVSKMICKGWKASTLVLCKGKMSRGVVDEQEVIDLRKEMYEANKAIGIEDVVQASFPDNAFDKVPLLDIIKLIEKEKRRCQPDIIFTHYANDLNIDHQITYRAVLTATRPLQTETVKEIYSMEIPSSTEWNAFSQRTIFAPNVFSDISTTIDLKLKAMSFYKSELRAYPHPRSLRHIRELARVNGTKVGLEYSENFILTRKIYA